MAFLTVEAATEKMLNSILVVTGALPEGWELKLFSNDHTPDVGDTIADYTEVSGGGYADFDLDKTLFTVSPGSPSQALYNTFLDFNFSAPTDAPGTVFGYYMLDGDGDLIGAERFPDDVIPFIPINGTLIRVRPQVLLGNVIP